MEPKGVGQNDDAALVTRVRRGDTRAFGAIVERYHAALLSVGRAYSRNSSDDADDAVQNALLLAFVHLGQL